MTTAKVSHISKCLLPFYTLPLCCGLTRALFKNPTEDQNKILRLESEKHDYQIHAKDSLRAICLEKSDVARKCSDLENSLTNARMEVTHHRNLHETVQAELIKGWHDVLVAYHYSIFEKRVTCFQLAMF